MTIEDDVVRITGTMTKTEEVKKEKRKYSMESMNSEYNYSFRLPAGAIEEKDPVCELADGILSMRFGKIKKTAPKKVAVTEREKSKKQQ